MIDDEKTGRTRTSAIYPSAADAETDGHPRTEMATPPNPSWCLDLRVLLFLDSSSSCRTLLLEAFHRALLFTSRMAWVEGNVHHEANTVLVA